MAKNQPFFTCFKCAHTHVRFGRIFTTIASFFSPQILFRFLTRKLWTRLSQFSTWTFRARRIYKGSNCKQICSKNSNFQWAFDFYIKNDIYKKTCFSGVDLCCSIALCILSANSPFWAEFLLIIHQKNWEI